MLEQHGVVAELAASNRVAAWAYGQTEAARGLTWLRADEMVPLAAAWRELLRELRVGFYHSESRPRLRSGLFYLLIAAIAEPVRRLLRGLYKE